MRYSDVRFSEFFFIGDNGMGLLEQSDRVRKGISVYVVIYFGQLNVDRLVDQNDHSVDVENYYVVVQDDDQHVLFHVA
jgi:hypothetical protein